MGPLISGGTVVFQPGGGFSNESFSTLLNPPRPARVVDLSICVRLMLYLYRPSIAYVFESGRTDGDDHGKVLRALGTCRKCTWKLVIHVATWALNNINHVCYRRLALLVTAFRGNHRQITSLKVRQTYVRTTTSADCQLFCRPADHVGIAYLTLKFRIYFWAL